MRRLLRTAILLALAAAAGCDQSKPAATAVALPAPTFGTGTITGRVTFAGTPPERKFIDNANCHAGATPIQEETIVVGLENALANVVVHLVDAPDSTGSAQPMLEMDQVNCRFVPHVVSVQVGQTLRIKSSDPVFHNVSYVSELNGSKNIALPNAGDYRDFTFTGAEPLRLRCDVHPWMLAWVFVTKNPFHTVTGTDGRFQLPRVPAGTYTVEAWHELLGTRRGTVTVNDGGSASIDFEFAPGRP